MTLTDKIDIMKYEIITDRLGIEKLAEDTFMAKDKVISSIDYTDFFAIKKFRAFEQAIICELNLQEKNWIAEFASVVKSLEPQLVNMSELMLFFIEGGEELTFTINDLSEILQILQSTACIQVEQSNHHVDILYSLRNRPSMPEGILRIELFAVCESE